MKTPAAADSVFPLARPTTIAPYLFCGLIIAVTLGLSIFILTMSFAPGFVRFVVDGEGINVLGDLYGSRLTWAQLKTEEAVPLPQNERPARRTNGLGLPNYASGWFDMKSGHKALLFVSEWSKAVRVPTTLDYDLIVSPETPDRFIDTIKAKGTASGRFGIAEPLTKSPGAVLIYLPIIVVLAVAGLMVGIMISIGRARVVFEPQGLRIQGAAMYGRLIPWEKIKGTEAALEDDFKGMWRSNGIGLPGYLEGWFRKFKGGSYLLFVTDRYKTVAVPTDAGFTLLVSPDDPDGFIQALRKPARVS